MQDIGGNVTENEIMAIDRKQVHMDICDNNWGGVFLTNVPRYGPSKPQRSIKNAASSLTDLLNIIYIH